MTSELIFGMSSPGFILNTEQEEYTSELFGHHQKHSTIWLPNWLDCVLALDPQSTAPLVDLYTQILSVVLQERQQLRILHTIWWTTIPPYLTEVDPEEIDRLLQLCPGLSRLTLRGLHSLFHVPPTRHQLQPLAASQAKASCGLPFSMNGIHLGKIHLPVAFRSSAVVAQKHQYYLAVVWSCGVEDAPANRAVSLRDDVAFLHASFADYLGDEWRSGRWCVAKLGLQSDYLCSMIQLLSMPPLAYNNREFYK
ncbi:hypothetical protein B0H19DRAFT_1058362 [Mycena capillaripes]|nr:hypothetical protein B0H19DRAFT_1058362 [Mycena capillaripes]